MMSAREVGTDENTVGTSLLGPHLRTPVLSEDRRATIRDKRILIQHKVFSPKRDGLRTTHCPSSSECVCDEVQKSRDHHTGCSFVR